MLKFTPEEMEIVRQSLPWLKHGECSWEQVGPCVYCADHNERLYHGTFKPRPAIHAVEGDGTGEALPPLPDDVYPDGASFLRSLDEG